MQLLILPLIDLVNSAHTFHMLQKTDPYFWSERGCNDSSESISGRECTAHSFFRDEEKKKKHLN